MYCTFSFRIRSGTRDFGLGLGLIIAPEDMQYMYEKNTA